MREITGPPHLATPPLLGDDDLLELAVVLTQVDTAGLLHGQSPGALLLEHLALLSLVTVLLRLASLSVDLLVDLLEYLVGGLGLLLDAG